MPKIRTGILNKRRRGEKEVNASDVAAIVTAAQAANNVPALRQAVADLATLVARLAEAVGLEPITPAGGIK